MNKNIKEIDNIRMCNGIKSEFKFVEKIIVKQIY